MRALPLFLLLAACAHPIDATHVVPASEAIAYRTTKLKPVAVLRGKDRAELPPGAEVDKTEIRVAQPGTFVYPLSPGETLERDSFARIVAVHTPGAAPGSETVTTFVPGTTEWLDDNSVKGELTSHLQRVPLLPGDKIELKGKLAPGDELPNGGSVDTSRAWSALVFGSIALAAGWFPSIYIAASSSVKSDAWLGVPGIGPWIALAERPDCISDPGNPIPTCLDDGTARIGLIADGVLQTVGLGLFIFGIPSYTQITWSQETQAKLRIAPMLGTANGLSIVGSF